MRRVIVVSSKQQFDLHRYFANFKITAFLPFEFIAKACCRCASMAQIERRHHCLTRFRLVIRAWPIDEHPVEQHFLHVPSPF